jgi:hypothetical protein
MTVHTPSPTLLFPEAGASKSNRPARCSSSSGGTEAIVELGKSVLRYASEERYPSLFAQGRRTRLNTVGQD